MELYYAERRRKARLDIKYGRLISRLYELRQSGDYDDKFDATEEEIMPYFGQVEQLLDVLKGLIGNNKYYIGQSEFFINDPPILLCSLEPYPRSSAAISPPSVSVRARPLPSAPPSVSVRIHPMPTSLIYY